MAVILLGERTGRRPEGQRVARAGGTLAIFGTMRAARELRLLDDIRVLSRADRERLGHEEVYISALRVEQLGRRRRDE